MARFRRNADNAEAEVFFDQSPTEFADIESEYLNTAKLYANISAAPRRPDITIRLSKPKDPKRYLLIELKKTEEYGYIRDSIYKVFGYLHDFRALWHDTSEVPKAVLVVPESVERLDQQASIAEDLAIVSGGDRSRMSQIMKLVLG